MSESGTDNESREGFGDNDAAIRQPSDPPTAHGDIRFFDTLRGAIFSSIPALSVLIFVIAAIKVFRVSGMEATTTVAIVSAADPLQLLKGVVLTLLPGFLTAVSAVALWWWADAIPVSRIAVRRDNASAGLLTPQAGLAWSMIGVTFFTVSWPLFVLLLLPAATVTIVLVRNLRVAASPNRMLVRLRLWLKGLSGLAAVLAVGFLALSPALWVPLRTIAIAPGQEVLVNDHALPSRFAAYILSQTADDYSLLLAKPRAVVLIAKNRIEPYPPLCVVPEAPTRIFYLRPSQIVGLDVDDHSPYQICPES